MAITVEVVQDWTADLDFILKNDTTPQNLTGATVTLSLTKRDGTILSTTGKVSVVNATAGLARYTPTTGDLVATDSPLSGRFKVTLIGKSNFYPSKQADCWIVRSP
jgi:hypothetical protein